jgi:hypothetical protein
MRTTSNQITHTIVKTTKTNAPAMIAADHPHEIAPTPRRAARTAQAITTETEHRYMRKRRNTRNKETNLKQKHTPSRTTKQKQKRNDE